MTKGMQSFVIPLLRNNHYYTFLCSPLLAFLHLYEYNFLFVGLQKWDYSLVLMAHACNPSYSGGRD
jgi:hypothetical protein